MLPSKYEIIMVPSNNSFFQYCDSNIGLFSIAPCKVITLNPFCFLFGISSLLLFWWLSLSKVIALPTIAIAIVVALSRSKSYVINDIKQSNRESNKEKKQRVIYTIILGRNKNYFKLNCTNDYYANCQLVIWFLYSILNRLL